MINMFATLIMSATFFTLGLLKIKVLLNKGYDVKISLHYITNKVLSLDSNFIVNSVKCLKFGNSSISMREVIATNFLRGALGSISMIWDWH